MSARDIPVRIGEVVAEKYRVTGILGRGGMGLVVEADHLLLRQPVAIKFLLRADNLTASQRFRREAEVVAQLRSEHNCRILDVGTLPYGDGPGSGVPYMVLERPVDPAASPQPRVRLATPDDADALAAVAADSFASDRFHRDPAIPTAVADHSRALWLRNAITDPGKQVIVAGDPVDPEARAGFLIARGGHGCHVLDLMAVARDHRRRGIGRALTDHFFYLARAAGATRAQVGTQDVNAASLNLYIGAGFRHAEARYTFHRHGGAR